MTPSQAADPVVLPVWPGAAPEARGDGPADRPEITVHRPAPAKANGTAVLICPGGGYGALMMSYEGHDVARWLNAFGVTGIVLKYRIRPYRHPAPFEDGRRAMRLLRSRADALGLDPARIGLMGFSAGGHLASTVGTHFDAGDPAAADPVLRVSSRPDFLILIYPVITMGPGGHAGCTANLVGDTATPDLTDWLSSDRQVTGDSPPAFLAHAKTDTVVSSEHSERFAAACRAANVAVEYLELPSGAHGLGCGKGPEWASWQAACHAWMRRRGLIDAP